MKIALIYGRSIEGCGVSKAGKEMQYWADKNNHICDVFSYTIWKYARKDNHKIRYTDFTENDLDSLADNLNNNYDIVVFHSYPLNKFDTKKSLMFFEFVKKLYKPVLIGFMHELIKMNVNKISYLVPLMNHMDIIYNFTEDTYFSQNISKILPSKKLGERTKKFTMWVNFDYLIDNFRNKWPLDKKEKGLLYLGRWTTMKDPRRVVDIGYLIKQQDPNFFVQLHGIESSVGAKFDIMDHPHTTYHKTNRDLGDGPIDVYMEYEFNTGMNLLASKYFGASFYALNDNNINGYGNRMEYTQIETIAVGTVPLFDKHWGENNFLKTGEKYIDVPYSAIYSDKNDLQSTADYLLELSNNKNEIEKYRQTGLDIVKSEYDADLVLKELFENALDIGKDKNKYSEEMLFLNIHENFYNDYLKETKKGNKVFLGIKQFLDKELSIGIEGKEQFIKKFENKKTFFNLI
jgi:hypothetical protein